MSRSIRLLLVAEYFGRPKYSCPPTRPEVRDFVELPDVDSPSSKIKAAIQQKSVFIALSRSCSCHSCSTHKLDMFERPEDRAPKVRRFVSSENSKSARRGHKHVILNLLNLEDTAPVPLRLRD
jgi:hypothetical protein